MALHLQYVQLALVSIVLVGGRASPLSPAKRADSQSSDIKRWTNRYRRQPRIYQGGQDGPGARARRGRPTQVGDPEFGGHH